MPQASPPARPEPDTSPAGRRPLSWVTCVPQAVRDAHEIYHPALEEPTATPQERGLVHRAFRVTTSRDGVELNGWLVPGDGPHTVVVCHGMGRTKASVLDHVELLHGAGHHVIAYDLRNHGASGQDGRFGSMADRFTSDLCDVVGQVRADPVLRQGKVGVLAFSFSTWPAVYALRDGRLPLAAVICDSGPLYDIPGGFVRYGGLRWSVLEREQERPTGSRLYRRAFQLAASSMLAVRGWPPPLPASSARLLFIAGGRDRIVPAEEVGRVAAAYPDAEHWVSRRATHMTAVRMDRDEYRRRVTGFLAEAFGTEARRAS